MCPGGVQIAGNGRVWRSIILRSRWCARSGFAAIFKGAGSRPGRCLAKATLDAYQVTDKKVLVPSASGRGGEEVAARPERLFAPSREPSRFIRPFGAATETLAVYVVEFSPVLRRTVVAA